LCFELEHAGIPLSRQVSIPVTYKGMSIPLGFRADIPVDGIVILEIKAVPALYQSAKAPTLPWGFHRRIGTIRCARHIDSHNGGQMGSALQITRTDHTSGALRAFAGKCRDGGQVRRLLALAMVLDGHQRSAAAPSNGMDRQTLRDWVHRYNEAGVEGLKTRPIPGRPAFLTEPQMAELYDLVVKGPDLATDKVMRWRCADLLAVVKRQFSVDVHESTIGKSLHQLRLTRLQPRPAHPKKDPEAETGFKTNFVSLVKAALLGTTAATPIEIWFQDEARVGQKGTHAYIWSPIGSRPLMVRDNRHDRGRPL
jgi:transposase